MILRYLVILTVLFSALNVMAQEIEIITNCAGEPTALSKTVETSFKASERYGGVKVKFSPSAPPIGEHYKVWMTWTIRYIKGNFWVPDRIQHNFQCTPIPVRFCNNHSCARDVLPRYINDGDGTSGGDNDQYNDCLQALGLDKPYEPASYNIYENCYRQYACDIIKFKGLNCSNSHLACQQATGFTAPDVINVGFPHRCTTSFKYLSANHGTPIIFAMRYAVMVGCIKGLLHNTKLCQ